MTRENVAKAGLVPAQGRHLELADALRKTSDGSAFSTLARLFVLGEPVAAAAAEAALGRAVGPLLDAGLLAERGADVAASAALTVVDGLLVLRDFEGIAGRPLARDHVLGAGFVTRLLGNLAVRRRGERVLDLGTGQGFQAMLAARHADKVIATDVNARALHFAAMNARLNGLPNIEFREGSFFEPVAGETFDLIVSNPPFVISPRHDLVFAGGRLEGDDVVRLIVEGAPALLREGGYAVVLANWFHKDEQDWAERPRRWLEGRGCDCWLVRFRTDSPEAYAASWIGETGLGGNGSREETMREWLTEYERLGAGAISMGAFFLRKRGGGLQGAARQVPHFFRADTQSVERLHGSASAQVERVFANQLLLEDAASRAGFMEMRWTLVAEHEVEQRVRLGRGGGLLRSLMRQTRGFEMPFALDGPSCALLSACDGSRSVREAAAELAGRMGAQPERFLAEAARLVEAMVRLGYLELRGG